MALRPDTSAAACVLDHSERYRILFDGNKAVELLIDTQTGAIVDANQAAVAYYGYRREELLARRISDINTLSEQELAAEMAAAQTERRSHFFFRHRLANGAIRHVEVHSGPLHIAGRPLLYSIVHDITERVRAEAALRASEEKYRAIVANTAEGYILIEAANHHIVEVNAATCALFGYAASELIGQPLADFAAAGERARLEAQMARIPDVAHRSYELTFIRKDGRAVEVRINATTLRDADGTARHSFGFLTDITEQKHTEEQLRLAATFFANTAEAIIITDAANRIVAVNPAFTHITGYSAEEVIGRDPSLLRSGRHNEAFYAQMWAVLQRMGRWQGEVWNRRKNGEVYPEWLSIVAIRDAAGNVLQHMAMFSDITRRKRDEQKIWRQANFDALTGLPNRTLFADRLAQALQAAHHENWQVALMFIDLDRFKWVNDTLGHNAGDHLLQEVAQRLKSCVNEMATVARLGGDEFTVVLPDIGSPQEAEQVAEYILHRLAEPILLNGHETFVSGSVGITLYPRDADSIENLMRNADSAMYRAKQAGRNTYRYFTQEMNAAAIRRLRLEHDLRRALDRGEFEVYYQPIVHGSDAALLGAEALLRWHHPEFGMVPPDEFIPLAEEIGAIAQIGRWVLLQAIRECAGWRAGGRELMVAVNVSAEQCRAGGCWDSVHEALQQAALPPGALKLEITERLMMEHTDEVVAMLNRLRAAGVHLAVDDFGTGYSSLSYLKRFPVDMLKIDREFIEDLPDNPDNVALVEAIIAMAHSLDLRVVAEGVETQAQERFLRQLNCDMMQGYYYARPMPADAFAAYLENA
jgi:diguanylate cyclase (GGDEF)-like protein/PAS domain S-box-containing protein